MVEKIYRNWQQTLQHSRCSDSLSFLSRKNIFIRLLEACLFEKEGIYYLLPELIDMAESNNLDPAALTQSLFLLRDQVKEEQLERNDAALNFPAALENLQEVIIKIGAYFSRQRVDMNLSPQRVSAIDSDHVEGNILQLNNGFEIVKTNSRLLTYFGYQKTEVIGHPINLLFSTSSQTLLNSALAQLKDSLRFKIDLEVEAQKKDGRKFQALLKISRINRQESTPVYSAYIQDNSYIRETKSMLNLLSMALESVGEGILILEPKHEGTILYVNEAVESMSGYPRQQLLGQSLAIFRGLTEPDELDRDIIRASLNGGWQGEIKSRNRKGKEYLIHLDTQPVKDENNTTVAIVGISRDITQQKSRENQILYLKRFVEQIINHLPHYVCVTDENLNIKFWNQVLEKELNISANQATDKKIGQVFPSLKKLNLEIVIRNVLATEQLFSKKFLSDIDGEERYYQLYITPLISENGKQLLWTIQDITKEELLKIHITWQNARLKFLENFSQLLNTQLDLKSIFLKFTLELKDVFPFKTLSFLLPYNISRSQFKLFFFFDEGKSRFLQQHTLDLSKEAGYQQLIKTKQYQVRNLAEKIEGSFAGAPGNALLPQTGQLVQIPIVFEKEILAVLNIGHDEADFYKKQDIDFLQQIASHLAIALKNSFYFNLIELQNNKLQIINDISNLPQNPEGIQNIFATAINGLCRLMDSQAGGIYFSKTGKEWEQKAAAQTGFLPQSFNYEFPAGEKTILWDPLHPLKGAGGLPEQIEEARSGIFSRQQFADGYYGIITLNNLIFDQLRPPLISELVEDILKQTLIALEKISLFEQVKKGEKEWETTFDIVNIGLAVVDEQYQIRRANPFFHTLFSINGNGLPQGNCWDIMQIKAPDLNNKDAQGKEGPSATIIDEFKHHRLDKIISRRFYPIFDQQKQFKGGVISCYDLTEQRQQEAQIKFLSKFPETNPNLVISIDQKRQVRYTNPAVQNLMKEMDIKSDELIQLLPADLSYLFHYFSIHKNNYLELEHRFRGRVFQYIIYRPTSDPQLYFYGTDITEKKELHRQLLQTERIRGVGEMAAGVAHDFNNLLATILGRTQLMQLKTENPELLHELEIVEKAASDGGQIVKRLQEVTRERRDSSYKPVDVNKLIKECIIFTANKLKISTQLKGKKVQLQTAWSADAVVRGAAVELKEVFTNLLLNAYDAMPEGGSLYISTQKTGAKNLRVTVRDTGVGMPEEVVDKVFNPFFTTKGEKGTGLGLSIAYKTISAHGGFIRVQSRIGKGTTFTITLPLSGEKIQEEPRRKVQIQDKAGEIRLLIVDDEPELLDTMAEILRLKFKKVEIARSGPKALEKLNHHTFDVVLTDLGMPEMSGWELARRCKELLPNAYVVLVTGWGDQAREELKHHPYVDDILPKPYELQELIQKIGGYAPAAE
ncbi:MAG: PAS domain-containing protein [Calditrichia bacterium]